MREWNKYINNCDASIIRDIQNATEENLKFLTADYSKQSFLKTMKNVVRLKYKEHPLKSNEGFTRQ